MFVHPADHTMIQKKSDHRFQFDSDVNAINGKKATVVAFTN